MKKLFKLFTNKHIFIPYRWSTSPTEYGQDKELTKVDEFYCAKCGKRVNDLWDFNKSDCK